MASCSVLDHGARADGSTLDTAAIQAAIDACHAAGGGRVEFPGGRTVLAGAIELRDRVELHLAAGSVLRCAGNIAACHEHQGRRAWSFIRAEEAEDCAITGGGTIDGNGRAFVEQLGDYLHATKRPRPHTILFDACRRVTVRGITIRDGANWTLRLTGCVDVLVHGIRIYSDLRMPNCDGIDPDHCRSVRISDCHIETGDDCICVKARREFPEYGPCEDIAISNCVLKSTSCALMIGIEAQAAMRNVVVDNCIIRGSNRGIGVHLAHECDVERVLFNNCIVETRLFEPSWWGCGEPIYVAAHAETPELGVGTVRDVRFSNILCEGENGIYAIGTAEQPLRGIVFDRIRLALRKHSRWPAGWQDRRPLDTSWQGGGASDTAGRLQHPTNGFFLEHVVGAVLRHCEVHWQGEPDPAFAHALEAHQVSELEVSDFRGTAARPDLPPVLLDRVTPAAPPLAVWDH